jgi:threonine dehydrogenase-like Zn-dependent dehydrogenase
MKTIEHLRDADLRRQKGASQTMLAARIVAPGQIELAELPLPNPGPGQVRIALQGCGLCASNLPVWEGRPWFNYPLAPGAPGHEGWGTVDAVGDDIDPLCVGQRVAVLSYHAYATHDIADADAVVKLPADSDAEFPGEPLGCAVNVLQRAEIRPGDVVCVIGMGFLGALLVQLAHQAGARVIAIARRQWACELAQRCGADEALLLNNPAEVAETVRTLTQGNGCARVIEVTGHQEPLDLAGQLVAVRGKLVIAGYHQDGLRHVNMQQWNWNGIDVINAHERDPQVYVSGIQRAAVAVASDQLKPQLLYSHRFPLERIADAFETASRRPDGFMKALIYMPGCEPS